MKVDAAVREVFEDVDPDPDGVLEGFGVDDPEELVLAAEDDVGDDRAGAHDPTTDAVLDADDATATELIGDLTTVSTAPESESRTNGGLQSPSAPSLEVPSPSGPASSDDAHAIDIDVFVSNPRVTVEHGTGSALEERRPGGSVPVDARSTDGFTLVGRSPEPVRIESDAFGVDLTCGSQEADESVRE